MPMHQPERELTRGSDQEELVHILWNSLPSHSRLFNGDPISDLSHHAYFEYYERIWGRFVDHGEGKYVAIQNRAENNRLIQDLMYDKSRQDLLAEICENRPGSSSADTFKNSLNLAARMFAMVAIGAVPHQFRPRPPLEWQEGSLRDFLAQHFCQEQVMNHDGVKLPKAFNGWSLEKIGRIRIMFTDNLSDHLRLDEDNSRLYIFPFVSFLECERIKGSMGSSGEDSILPIGLAEESLQTLALLFPQSIVNSLLKSPKRIWFRKLCENYDFTVDKRLGKCGNLHPEHRQIKNFKFWRDRLVILKQAYDEATPRSISQFWYDRRNGVQWYTFWVAIIVLVLTAIFGLVQCIEGGFEAWKP